MTIKQKVIDKLELPEAKQIKNLDDPNNNIYILRRVIQRKTFLRNIYVSFYNTFFHVLSSLKIEGKVVEFFHFSSLAGNFMKIGDR